MTRRAEDNDGKGGDNNEEVGEEGNMKGDDGHQIIVLWLNTELPSASLLSLHPPSIDGSIALQFVPTICHFAHPKHWRPLTSNH